MSLSLLGGLAALGSAASWALGSILFRRIGEVLSPFGMNMGKGLMGLVLLGVAVLLVGWQPVDGRSLLFLAASGLVGIALGDTFFFMALVRLDPRLTVLLATVGVVMSVLLGMAFLGEHPGSLVFVGAALVMAGVTWVMMEDVASGEDAPETRRAGIVYGLLAALCMSTGFLLAKLGVEEIDAMQATWLRLGFGMAGLAIYGAVRRELPGALRPLADPALIRRLLGAVVVIMFGGFYLSQLALKLTDLSVASVLNATEPLFILPLAVLMQKEKVSPRAILGAVLAVAGVALVVTQLQ